MMKQLQLLFVCLHLILIVSCRTYHQPWVELPSSYYHHDPLPRRETPLDFMVHVVNRLGLRLLEEHSRDKTLYNLALSPYGATSVIVAIAEGTSDSAKNEIFDGANLPCDISVLRIGLRDMHRHLKSYFIPREGFLAGLTLNSDNVSMTKEYENVLRFYGYDVSSFNSALTPSSNGTSNSTTSNQSNTTTTTTPSPTMATSESQDSSSTGPTETTSTEEVPKAVETTTIESVTEPDAMESRTTTEEAITNNTPAEFPDNTATSSPVTIESSTLEETGPPNESTPTERPSTTSTDEISNPTEQETTPGNENSSTINEPETTSNTPSTPSNTPTEQENNPSTQGSNSNEENNTPTEIISSTTEQENTPSGQGNLSNDDEVSSINNPTSVASDSEGVGDSVATASGMFDQSTPSAGVVVSTTQQENSNQEEIGPSSENTNQQSIVSETTSVDENTENASNQENTPTTEVENSPTIQTETPTQQDSLDSGIENQQAVQMDKPLQQDSSTSEELTSQLQNISENEESSSQATTAQNTNPTVPDSFTPNEESTLPTQEITSAAQGSVPDVEETPTGQSETYALTAEAGTSTTEQNNPTEEIGPSGEASSLPTGQDITIPTGQENSPTSPQVTSAGEQSPITSEGITVPTGQDEFNTGTSNVPTENESISTEYPSSTATDEISNPTIENSSPVSQETTAPSGEEQTIPVIVENASTPTAEGITNPTSPGSDYQDTSAAESETTSGANPSSTGNDKPNENSAPSGTGEGEDNGADDDDEPEDRKSAIDITIKSINKSAEFDDSINKLDKSDRISETEFVSNSFTEAPMALPLTLASITMPHPNPINESPLLGFQNTNRVIRNGKRSFSKRKRRHVPQVREEVVYGRYYDEFHLPTINSYGFEPPRPRPLAFLVNGKTENENVNFMNYDTVLPYHFSPELNAMALRLPLDIPKYYLLLVLPVNEQGVDKLICHMSAQCDLKYLISKLKNRYVKATIPSFTLKGVVSLKQPFQKLGLQKIFEPRQTNFSKMTTDENIYVTNIEQAVTVTIKNYLIQTPGRYSYSYNPIVFKATHPFLYFVMDSHLDVALMTGKITNPSNERIR